MSFARSVLVAFAAALALAAAPARAQLAGKKVLFVNSYHEGYAWSDGEEKGALAILQPAGVELEFIRMDVKRHQGDVAFGKAAAQTARAEIEARKPDVVILSDDPAVQLVLVPFFKESPTPFVFCGVNWDATKYGLGKNATGMVEVSLVKELLTGLKEYAKGSRVGFLTVDSETEHIEGPYYTKALGLSFAAEKYVKTMAGWKEAFLKMQGEVDVLFLGNFAGINDWNEADAAAFALAESRIPSGTIYDFMMPYAMLGYTKVAEEQGIFAATAALDILKGAAPSSIPVAANKRAKIFINPKVAARAGIIFKPELVKMAEVAK
jgi:ABC-type uncharacterized transport system substrate-binding protein